jgi:hypothetical protein
MKDRYRALRAVVALLRGFAWIVAVFGTLVVVGAALNTATEGGGSVRDWMRGLSVVVAGILVVGLQTLLLSAAGALITLLVDIERNTRATAEMFTHLIRPTDTEPLG